MARQERRFELASDPTSVGEGRRRAADTLEAWELGHLVDDLALVVSELVTNAVLHARTPCELVLSLSDGTLRVEVADDSPAIPRRKIYGSTATTGRGLGLVEVLSRAWGVDRRNGGKVVWVEIDPFAVDADRASAGEVPAFDLDDLDALEAALLGTASPGATATDDEAPSAQGTEAAT